jgi:hypothetical protein
MKRDYEKHIHLTISIVKGSPTHLALLHDAEQIGTKQLPTVAAVRLKDYYAGVLQGLPERVREIVAPSAFHRCEQGRVQCHSSRG